MLLIINIELIQLLIEYGADVNNINVNATTILDYAKKASQAKDYANISKYYTYISWWDTNETIGILRLKKNHLKISPIELEQLLK